ncbi:MAG: hypothetical protein JOZ46_12425 [Candidatus Dormibacteraeota bacterium]|nr:hypothetical protein [Candidatus Dormibacteraeota bacterium]MBV9526606.1 hypothetical protein [Candidatus Dormibacteraeota bacterium]
MGLAHISRIAVALTAAAGSFAAAGAAGAGAQGASCPVGDEAVTNVHYAIFDPNNTSHNATRLRGNVDSGDQVNVLFDVPALPAGCSDVTLTIATYTSPVSPRHMNKLTLFSQQSQSFIAGGGYEMSATIAPHTSAATRHFQIDFATGPVLTPPDYDSNLIDSAQH